MRKLVKIGCLLIASLTSVSTQAWTLIKEDSTVSFISIKKNNIGESHHFTDIGGSIFNGRAVVSIKPDSVDSRVPIRNERMREFLFKTQTYPIIKINADVADTLNNIKAGDSKQVEVPAMLSMHGVTEEVMLDVRVNALSDSKIIVSSVQPVIIRAASFGMVEGIQKLSGLVNGLAIAESVPVSFSLMFQE